MLYNSMQELATAILDEYKAWTATSAQAPPGDSYVGESNLDVATSISLAEVANRPSPVPMVSQQATPNWDEINRIAMEHPEIQPLLAAAAAKPTPEVPLGYTFGQTYGGALSGATSGLRDFLSSARGILTLVVVGIAGLAVLAVRR